MPAEMPDMSWPQQSPIDIKKSYFTPELAPLLFQYPKAISGRLDTSNPHHPNFIVNQACGAVLQFESMTCPLAKIHFHTPSEHKLNGRSFQFEVHLVHKIPAFPDDFSSAYVVVGVLFNPHSVKRGKKLPVALESVVEIAKFRDRFGLVDSNIAKGLFALDFNENKGGDPCVESDKILPPDTKREFHYRYEGALTTPTFSEFVSWVVLRDPVELMKLKVEEETEQDARDCQPINRRFVLRNFR